MSDILDYLIVYLLSGVKFFFGPAYGLANQLSIVIIIPVTSAGMMTTIYLFTFFGDQIRSFVKRLRGDQKLFSKKSRRFVKIWKKYGLIGMCLLTPVLFTPPGGGLLINIFGTQKKLILKWMWISAGGWSIIITLAMKFASDLFAPIFT
ncbi:MAG: hypothetical protein AAF789_11505 [Bacteroidota bacterium]